MIFRITYTITLFGRYLMLSAIFSAIQNFFCLILGISAAQNFPPPLSPEEEKRLFSEKKAGNQNARSALIEHNLRLVAHIVRKYYVSYSMPDELISIGSLGLMKAVDSFDDKNGAKFATYASKCIQNEILMFFRSQKKLNAEVSITETIDTDKDGNPLTYIDIISVDDTIADDLDFRMQADKAVRLVSTHLSPREREIIVMRYGLSDSPPKTQRDVAKILGISRSYVSRIEKKALYILRKQFGDTVPSFHSEN